MSFGGNIHFCWIYKSIPIISGCFSLAPNNSAYVKIFGYTYMHICMRNMQEKYGDICGKNKHQIGSNCHGGHGKGRKYYGWG